MAKIARLCGAAALVAAAASPGTGSAQDAAPADLATYGANSATLAAVAAAAAQVEPCSVPITYEEVVIESYETVELTVSCSGEGDEQRSVILRFLMLEGDRLLPQSFEAVE